MNSITNVQVYGLEESMIAGTYPMATDVTEIPDTDRYIDRAKKLGKAGLGTGHSNFLKGIVVQFDWRNSLLIQRQILRYHFLDIVSSQSTMHRALQMDLVGQVNEWVDTLIVERCQQLIDEYNALVQDGVPKARLDFQERIILYSLPSGYNLTARYTTNYLQLKTVYQQRKSHKLLEWQEFCSWCETLPMFKTLVGIE